MMAKRFSYDVVHRWEGNPLLTIEDIPFPCNTVFNAACAKYNGQYILLLRVEDLRFLLGNRFCNSWSIFDRLLCLGSMEVAMETR